VPLVEWHDEDARHGVASGSSAGLATAPTSGVRMNDHVRIVRWPSGTEHVSVSDLVPDELWIAVPVGVAPAVVARQVETLLHEPHVVDLREQFADLGANLAGLGQQVVESLEDDGRV
jgi:hypothetical protein